MKLSFYKKWLSDKQMLGLCILLIVLFNANTIFHLFKKPESPPEDYDHAALMQTIQEVIEYDDIWIDQRFDELEQGAPGENTKESLKFAVMQQMLEKGQIVSPEKALQEFENEFSHWERY